MNVPGIIAKHKFVTQQCRLRPIDDIKRETVDELWDAYKAAVSGWSDDSEVIFHFALTVERPKESA